MHDPVAGPHAGHHSHGRAGQGPPVLDIGDDIGALVLLTPDSLLGREIEVSPVADPDHRTHTEVLRRTTGGRAVCAAVYMALPAGTYRIWTDEPDQPHEAHVSGGEVTQIDWR